jgi:hypothetical protein
VILTEHQARLQISSIRASGLSPFSKAKQLLRICRALDGQESVLHRERELTACCGDSKVEMGFHRMESHIHQLKEEALDAAFEALNS